MNYENDFKYVIQDLSTVQLGARFTYEELLKHDRVPFKFQSIIQLYLLKEAKPDEELGAHILKVNNDSFAMQVFRQLKVKVKFYAKNKNGNGFQQKVLKLPEFVAYRDANWQEGDCIHEIIISNLALMTFTV